jgi:hypothetical protein
MKTVLHLVLALFCLQTALPAQVLVATNSTWRWSKGTNEASSPIGLWRTTAFNDASWASGPGPFHYGEGIAVGTLITDMQGNYSCIFLRQTFNAANAASIHELILRALCDDGFVAWINGVEVARFNMPAGGPAYNSFASAAAPEPVFFQNYTLPNPSGYLVEGENVLTAQVFNNQINSSDLQFNAELFSTAPDTTPPAILSVSPAPGAVGVLGEITLTFTEPVTGIGFSDFLIDGQPALTMTGSGAVFTFFFDQPPDGTVHITWAPEVQIRDSANNLFDPNAPGATWNYTLTDVAPPMVAGLEPLAGVTVRSLNQIEVTFSEPVTGVDAADLLINGIAAASVSGIGAGPYQFQFTQPPTGQVQVAWAPSHGIRDLAATPNLFAGGAWSYTLDPNFALAAVRINEFLAANQNGLKDEDGDAEDWIELHNRGDSTVDLSGWSLTDDAKDPGKWTFPAVALAPGQYLVVFASGKDRKPTTPGSRLHTNFRLGSSGEFLALYNSESPRLPMTVFAPEYPEQRTDHSFGFDGADTLRYFSTPTPGAANGSSSISGLAPAVHFNVRRGLFHTPFSLRLSTPMEGAVIRYTTNGTEPSQSVGSVYTGPLEIATTTILRAAAFKAGHLPSLPETHTYIFPEKVLEQPQNPTGFPSTWGSWSQVDYEMDPEIVTNAVYRARILEGLESIPTLSIVMNTDDMFGSQGIYSNPTRQIPTSPLSQVEKAASAELIHPDGKRGFQVDCAIRIQGGASRNPNNNPKHSLRLLFKGDYGPGKLREQFFPDSPLESFDTIILRGEYNNSWIHWDPGQRSRGSNLRDQWGRSTQIAMSGLGSHGNYVHLYINGLYWGLFNPSERMDASFAASYLGGEKEEYDTVKQPVTARDGNLAAWNTMMGIARSGLSNNARYEELQQYLDVAHFADYMILNIYGGNADWPHNNWAAVRRRVPGAQFKFLSWDIERILESPTDTSKFNASDSNSPGEIYSLLRQNPEFRLLFADRLHQHFFNGGALTPEVAIARYRNLAEQIDLAVAAESARWGDYRRDVHVRGTAALYTYFDHWLPELNRVVQNYLPQRSAFVVNQFRSINLYPNVTAPAFNQHGGAVPRGFNLIMTAPSGTIHYTTNGADPRVYGTGAVSPQASSYTGPISLNGSMVIKARVLSGSTWSALNEAEFQVAALGVPLRITEIMYHPIGGDAYEFLEMQNTGTTPIDLGGFSLQGVTFVFPVGTLLHPAQVLVLSSDKNPAGFDARYPGLVVAGRFSGNLSNGGERIAIVDPAGRTITSVEYDDENGWPTEPDGNGPSLEIIDVNGDPNDPANWRASAALHGTPGTVSPFSLGAVRLSEVMAENISSVPRDGAFPDWIELHNNGSTDVSLAGWSLTDNDAPRRFVFPAGASIPPGGYLIVWCSAPTATPGLYTGFALSRGGETVLLYDANTNRVDGVTFGRQLGDFTIARIDGEWQLALPTPGASNTAAPLAAPTNLVINEWLANSLPGQADWLELHNQHDTLPAALRGMYLATSNAVFQIGSLTFVAPGGFIQLLANELPGPHNLDFKLPGAGGAIALHDASGTELNRVLYGPQEENVSQGRFPDGAQTFVTFPGTASPGASNYRATYAGPRVNEIMAWNTGTVQNSAGRAAGWVELYNPGEAAFDLSGMRLSTNPSNPNQWVFPSSTLLPAGGYLVVWFDSSRDASTAMEPDLNTGRTLNRESGGVHLFNLEGQVVQSVGFGFQIPDRSIGNSGGDWRLLDAPTPGAANSGPAALGSPAPLTINEWMARPLSGDDWVEIYNPSTLPVELTGLVVTDDLSAAGRTSPSLGALSFIGARNWVRLFASGSAAGRNHVAFALNGEGEAIRIYAPDLSIIDTISFGPQEQGVSEGRLPDGAPVRSFFPETASPGESNYLPLPYAWINEVLPGAQLPFEQAIELYNPTSQAADIGGWFLSDSRNELNKFRIPDGTILPAGGYAVIYQNQFGAGPNGFALQPFIGGELFLSMADEAGNLAGFRDSVAYGPSEMGVSSGRIEACHSAQFVPLQAPTFGSGNPASVVEFRAGMGAPNAGPLVAAVVINELMYNPPRPGTEDNTLDEYIELHNPGSTAVALYHPDAPAQTWGIDDGVRFAFPQNTVIPPGGFLLVVNFNPVQEPALLAEFRARYAVPEGTPILGPYNGNLSNSGETIDLRRPMLGNDPVTGADFVYHVIVDRVGYKDEAPWPFSPDGSGDSLQRRFAGQFGNDAGNWTGAAPTAGRANATTTPDAPVILLDPVSRNASPGGTVFFDVAVCGTEPLSYQWRFNNADILGATNRALERSNVQPSDAGAYSVRVSNAADSVVSGEAVLSFIELPVITVHPQGGTVFPGTNLVLSVFAEGPGPLHYQWRLNGGNIFGATNSMLPLADVGSEHSGDYTVLVGNAAGFVASRAASVQVSIPPNITAHPESRTVNPGVNVSFSVTATGTGTLHYQWQRNIESIPGATAPTLNLSSVTLDDSGAYTVVVTDDLGGVVSQPALLTVLVRPEILQHPFNQTVLVGDTVTFKVELYGTEPFGYRWRYAAGGSSFFSEIVSFANGAATYTIPNVQTSHAGAYEVIVTNLAFLSPGIRSSAGRLTVLEDTDGDGMPDLWEIEHGFNPNDPSDAELDSDGDGMTNREEWVAGTDPNDSDSYLRFDEIQLLDGVSLGFTAASNRTYTVEYADVLGTNEWRRLIDLNAQTNTRPETVIDPAPSATRFYRLLVPHRP